MSSLGVAVVGCGDWGLNLVRNFGQAPDCELRWVVDLEPQRSARAGRSCTVGATQSIDEVLDDPRVAAVAIATPPQSHFQLASRCLDAGRHVLVEKPMACSVLDGEQLTTTARRHGLVLMCDHTYCYAAEATQLRELVHRGDLGVVQHIESTRLSAGKVQAEVDVFWDLAAHDLALVDYILPRNGRIDEMTAGGSDPLGAGRACAGHLDAHLSDGSRARVHVSWLSQTKVRRFTVAGTRGVAVWDDLRAEDRLTLHEACEHPQDQGTRVSGRRSPKLASLGGLTSREEPLQAVVREFISSVAERREPRTGGQAALRVLHGLSAASRSLALGGATVPVATHEPEPSTST
jgi:predicted dehydrogenase